MTGRIGVAFAVIIGCTGCALGFDPYVEPAPSAGDDAGIAGGADEDAAMIAAEDAAAAPDAMMMLMIDGGASRRDAGSSTPPPPPPPPPPGPSCGEQWSFTPANVDPCAGALASPSGALAMNAAGEYVLDTSTVRLTRPDGSRVSLVSARSASLFAIAVTELHVGSRSTLVVRGEDALAIVVHGDAQIAGAIIVEAGARDANECGMGAGSAGESARDDDSGGGGGGGGAFGANGGTGGDGGGHDRGHKGARGDENGAASLEPIFGGCPGGQGSGGSEGGRGGGAIELAVRDVLSIGGRIESAGLGGGGGAASEGGGGGGSGGAILIEAASLTVEATAHLCANGGSGAEGGSFDEAGADGERATCSSTGATTNSRSSEGGAGGDGGSRLHPSGTNGERGDDHHGEAGGGGGGGGGVGRIRLRSSGAAMIDPSASISPEAAL